MQKRSVPASVAPLLQELELEQPLIVTADLLVELLARTDVDLTPEEAARRLQRHGWLLSLRTQGVWEFAPASRAGPLGSGDPFIELRATLARRPSLEVAVAYESAIWLHNLSQRAPARHVLAVDRDEDAPHALRDFRITRSRWKLSPVTIDALPVWRLQTVLVLIAAQPLSFRDWPNVMEWMRGVDWMDVGLLLKELEGRPRATWMRVGYLLDSAGKGPLAQPLHEKAPPGSGPFYLGKRDVKGHYDKFWEVRDSLLHRKDGRNSFSGSGPRHSGLGT